MSVEMEKYEQAINLSLFTRRFVSERKQISLMADEKSPARNSHRFFETSCSEMEENAKIHKLKIFAYHFVPQASQSNFLSQSQIEFGSRFFRH